MAASNRCAGCKYSRYTYSKIMQARVHECTYKNDSRCARAGRKKKNTPKEQPV